MSALRRQIYETDVTRCERDDAPVAEVFAHQTKARYPLLGRIVYDWVAVRYQCEIRWEEL